MIIYSNSLSQHMVEIFFLVTAYPVCNLLEMDKITANTAFCWLAIFFGLSLFNTIMANILKGGKR